VADARHYRHDSHGSDPKVKLTTQRSISAAKTSTCPNGVKVV
jgi:hypothetical protein